MVYQIRPNKKATIQTLLMAVTLVGNPIAASAQTQSFTDTIIVKIQERRTQGFTCPEIVDQNANPDPAKWFPAAPALIRSNKLDSAAAAYRADRLAGLYNEPPYLGPTGYLPWDSWYGEGSFSFIDPTFDKAVNATLDGIFKGDTCRAVMDPNFTEFGLLAVPDSPGKAAEWGIFLAKPFDPLRQEQYAREIFDVINQRRTAGGKVCPKTTSPVPPKAAFTWDSGLAQLAQKHSTDMVNWPYTGTGSPHVGSNGLDTQARAKANCIEVISVGENVSFNSGIANGGIADVVDGWLGLSPGHCQNVLSDGPFSSGIYAGIGVAQATPFASVATGRGPFVTLVTAAMRCSPKLNPGEVGQPEPSRYFRTPSGELWGCFRNNNGVHCGPAE